VQDLNDYAKVLQTIRHLSPVAGVSIKDMNGAELSLTVTIVGGEQALADALSSNQHFISLDTSDDTNADLAYRWQGTQNSG
jgi:hypothetical protein